MSDLQERIGYLGNLAPVLSKVCDDYQIGKYISHSIIVMGYEDFNLVVETSHHNFFIKIFAEFRDRKECKEYIEKIKSARYAGVSQPEIYLSIHGEYLYEIVAEEKPIRLCVMQYIEGEILFESHTKLSWKEAIFLIKEAAKINKITLSPTFIYDSWAIVNFLKELEKKMQYLSNDDQLILPLISKFKQLNLDALPHCFVHGDLIKTNIMRGKNGKLYILDYAVANYYPRIQEIAVLMCDTFFDTENLDLYDKMYDQTIGEYQKYIKLESIELQTLPFYIQVANAMQLLCAIYEKKVNNNKSPENEYFLKLGRLGLQFTSQHFRLN